MENRRKVKYWATVFRGFGNPHRLRILQLLKAKRQLSVSELAGELSITLKNTSRNLAILSNLDIVEFQGRQGKVYYSLNSDLSKELRRILGIST